MSSVRSVKVKVKLSLCLTKHHAMKTYWGSGCIAPLILDLGTRWRWVVIFTPGRFTPRERAPGTHWMGGRVGLGAVLDAVVKRKIPSPRRESNPRTPIIQPVAQRYTDWAITALMFFKFEIEIAVVISSSPISKFQSLTASIQCIWVLSWSQNEFRQALFWHSVGLGKGGW
jgi:hypothetical protein